MKTDALAVANYLIELAKRYNKPIHLLGLVKRVYIAHGFSLAINEKGLINPRFDKVEAWKYGPVIPSVYHTFKQYKAQSITECAANMIWNEASKQPEWFTPMLTNEEDKKVVEMVWKRYAGFQDSELVSLTHRKGTPWYLCYVESENVPIPDELTAIYYKKLVENIISTHERGTL